MKIMDREKDNFENKKFVFFILEKLEQNSVGKKYASDKKKQ